MLPRRAACFRTSHSPHHPLPLTCPPSHPSPPHRAPVAQSIGSAVGLFSAFIAALSALLTASTSKTVLLLISFLLVGLSLSLIAPVLPVLNLRVTCAARPPNEAHASSELWAGSTFLGCMRRVSCGPGPLFSVACVE